MLGKFAEAGRVVRGCWVNFQCRSVLLLDQSRARPAELAVGAGGVFFLFWTFFLSRLSFLSFLHLSGRRPDVDRNTVSKGHKPKTTNQPNPPLLLSSSFGIFTVSCRMGSP